MMRKKKRGRTFPLRSEHHRGSEHKTPHNREPLFCFRHSQTRTAIKERSERRRRRSPTLFVRTSMTLDIILVALLGVFSLFLPTCCSFVISTTFRSGTTRHSYYPYIDDMSLQANKVGFIGCGTIAAAIATGLATTDEPLVSSIAISRRSKSKSAALAEKFPNLVTVHDDNQEILDQADIIFITVLPKQASEVLKSLKFDPERHDLVSLVSTAKLDDLIKDSGLDASKVSKMICLPSIASHQGVCLHCSPTPNPTLTDMFHRVSGVVTLTTEAEMEAAMVTSCIMGPLYGIMKEGRDWLLRNTSLSAKDASYLIIQQYTGAVKDAERECDTNEHRLDDLIEEQTPGGLNEQALSNLDQLGGLEAQRRVMDATLSRIRGDSDGSIGG